MLNPQLKFLLMLIITGTLLYSCKEKAKPRLPILGRKIVNVKEVHTEKVLDTVYHTIADFSFIDQDSMEITQETFRGKIYVADFFFTSCPTICPLMKAQMLRVYHAFKDSSEVMILSHTIDPSHDSVAVLKDYAERLGVTSDKWHFVTGDKHKLFEIGQKSYLVTAQEDQFEPGGYLHSGAFILVDKNRRIRGLYDGTKAEQVDRLIDEIPLLLQESPE